MATRAYIVNVIDENRAEVIYNHFDGGEYLNKALNQNKLDPDDIFTGVGDIRSIDLETGDIERYPDRSRGTFIIKGDDLSETLQEIVGRSGDVSYLQVFNPTNNEWVMINRSKGFDRTLVNLFDIYGFLEKEDEVMENKEFDLKNYLSNNPLLENEDMGLMVQIDKALEGADEGEVAKYKEAVQSDIKSGDVDQYKNMSSGDIVEDFENYIADLSGDY